MDKKKVYVTANVALVIIAGLLLLNFFGVDLPSLGEATYNLDNSEQLCLVQWQGALNKLTDYDRCCLESVKLGCEKEIANTDFGEVNYKCGSPNSVSYLINKKQSKYCNFQSFG